eukprot:SAG31_NODE_2836_length_5019_cov_2.059350_9_plen_303_part_00
MLTIAAMRTIQQVAVALLTVVLASANAHVQPARRLQDHPHHRHKENCTCVPGSRPAESYHIHVMFYGPDAPHPNPDDPAANNPNNKRNALALRTAFMDHFEIAECEESGWDDPTELCAFPVDQNTGGQPFPAAQPFVTPEFAFFVPLDRWSDAVPWMMLHRGVFDVLVHPNTCGWACAPQDHLLSSLWMGKPWPVKFRLPEAQHVGAPSTTPQEPPPQEPPPAATPASPMDSTRAIALVALALASILTLLRLIAWGQRAYRRNDKNEPSQDKMLAPGEHTMSPWSTHQPSNTATSTASTNYQ